VIPAQTIAIALGAAVIAETAVAEMVAVAAEGIERLPYKSFSYVNHQLS
jgi:hypothetical protein